ncbi:MAG: hypothetical protein WAW37_00085 [Syntrophobacteraceae bacterium]
MAKESMKTAKNDKDDKFAFWCPHCETIHVRGAWSAAHADIEQLFGCDCGETIILKPLR